MGSFTYDVITWGRGEGGEVAADDEVSYFSYGKYNSNIADEGGRAEERIRKGHFCDDVLYERSPTDRPVIEVINMPHNYFHLLTTTAKLGAKHKI